MRPIEFPEQTVVWAENQSEYLPLPAYTDETETISLWKLSWGERLIVLLTGTLWIRQSNFRQPLQAILPTIDNPWEEE